MEKGFFRKLKVYNFFHIFGCTNTDGRMCVCGRYAPGLDRDWLLNIELRQKLAKPLPSKT